MCTALGKCPHQILRTYIATVWGQDKCFREHTGIEAPTSVARLLIKQNVVADNVDKFGFAMLIVPSLITVPLVSFDFLRGRPFDPSCNVC
jgi:hypothetical protein